MPADSLLRTHRPGPDPAVWENSGDCFFATVAGDVSLAEYSYAFYTSRVFKLERLILRWLINKPSTDAEARELADGRRDTFAAWKLGPRTETQLLMADFMGRTRSWLSVVKDTESAQARSLLRFGSGIAKRAANERGAPRTTWGFRMLGPVHIVYSQILLRSAISRLRRLGVC